MDRIENRGASPESVLALTFSRKAAEQLRDRVTARLGRTTSSAMCSTFHSFAYGLIRRYSPPELYAGPLRLLSAPEQDVVLRELLTETPESVQWPDSLRRALGTRGFAREVHAVLGRAREKGLDGDALRALGLAHDLPEYVAAGLFLEQYLLNLDQQSSTDYTDLIRRAVIEAAAHRDELRAQFHARVRGRVPGHRPGPGGAAPAARRRRPRPHGRRRPAPVDLRLPRRRGARHPRLPARVPRPRRRDRPTCSRSPDDAAVRPAPADGDAAGGRPDWPCPAPSTRRLATRSSPRSRRRVPSGRDRVEVTTYETERAEAEHLADLLRRAHLEDGIEWTDMAVLVRSGRNSIPGLRRALAGAGVPVEVACDECRSCASPLSCRCSTPCARCSTSTTTTVTTPSTSTRSRPRRSWWGRWSGSMRATCGRCRRDLRAREKAARPRGGTPARPSPYLLRAAVGEDGFLAARVPSIRWSSGSRRSRAPAQCARRDPRLVGHGGGGPVDALVGHQLARAPASRRTRPGVARPEAANRDLDAMWRCSRRPRAPRSSVDHKSA